MSISLFILSLLSLKGIGRKGVFKIINALGHDRIAQLETNQELLIEMMADPKVNLAAKYSQNEFKEAIEKAQETIEISDNLGCHILSVLDPAFPAMLRGIPDPPIILFCLGDPAIMNSMPGVAIIGTRNPTPNGVKAGEYFGEQLSWLGFNIISGLAKGCDTAAHEGCLKAGGKTTAFVAHGLHTIYPLENKGLADRIIASGGVLVSEYPPGIDSRPNFFVERDRLQAGLAKGTLVIQTDVKGGTMHTVRDTLALGKPLGAVKYKLAEDLHSPSTAGNQILIGGGDAMAVDSNNWLGFVEELGIPES